MDELCKLLAEKLGLVADASMSWLQTAIPQYAEMMAIRMTLYSVASLLILFVFIALAVFFTVNAIKKDTDLMVCAFGTFLVVMFFGFLTACVVPDAICWYVTPDAMLLKELAGAVR